MRVTVPANVLLLGEYAVLEEGGVGVTLAVEPRITATLTRARRLELTGRWGGGRIVWTDTGEPDLFSHAVESVATFLGMTTVEVRRIPLHVQVDSTPFFDPLGGKRGFGSSAAAAVALCYSLLDFVLVGPEGRAITPASLLDSTFTCSLRAHRAFQGGRGSGYDIAASVYGGVGRFVGGTAPRFGRADLPWLPPLTLFRGSAPVKTRNAVARYEAWKAARPREAQRFLARSNECVEGFLTAGSWREASQWVEAARDLSVGLGSAIGTPGQMHGPSGFGGVVKAVGAGDELGVAFGSLEAVDGRSGELRPVVPLRIAPQGAARGTHASGSGDDAQG